MTLFYKTLGDSDGNDVLTIEIDLDSEGCCEGFTVTGLDRIANRAVEDYYWRKYLNERKFTVEIDEFADRATQSTLDADLEDEAVRRAYLSEPTPVGQFQPFNMTLRESVKG